MTRILVVGGGVMGLAIAREARVQGAAEVTLFERRFCGAGSSGKSGAILRTFYPKATLVEMARDSRVFYQAFRERFGRDIGYEQPGMLFLAAASDAALIHETVALQTAAGVEARVVTGAEILEIEPNIALDRPLVGAFEPGAAFVDPIRTVDAFRAAAEVAGATVVTGESVTTLVRDGARIVGVTTDRGEHRADVVVLATGAWTARLLQTAGLSNPIIAVRPEQAYLEPPAAVAAGHPIVADLTLNVYFKREGGRGTRIGKLGFEDDDRVNPDAYDEGCSGAFVDWARKQLSSRIPPYRDAVSWGGCGALYAVTPDAQAMIGPLEGVPGLFLAAGFSGHGFKLAPSVGKGVAEWLLTGRPSAFDAAFFDPGRFAAGRGHRAGSEYPVLG